MVDKDILKVAHIPGLEPEEQPTTREVEISLDVKGSRDGRVLGQVGSQIEITKPAGDVARELRHACANCKHFDTTKAMALFLEKEKTPDGQQELRNLKANLLQVSGANLSTLGSSASLDDLKDLGYCHAWSSTDNEVITHPLGNCPTRDWGDRFEPIDRAAEKRGDKAYDKILKIAEGKTE